MSIFGDTNSKMNYLYDNIEDFFDEGGTLSEFYEVLEYYFSNNEFIKKEDKQ